MKSDFTTASNVAHLCHYSITIFNYLLNI